MSEIIKRDEDFTTVAAAVTLDVDQDVTMFRVDPITSYLLVSLSPGASGTASPGSIAKRDQNHVPVCLAWDAVNEELVEVLTDNEGRLLVDILIT